MNVTPSVEAMIFQSAAPVSKKTIAGNLRISNDECENVISEIKEKYQNSGFVLLDDGTTVSFAVNPAIASVLEKEEKRKKEEPLSQSIRETLAVIAYAGPISRLDLDIIRGVNSRYSVDKLIYRGYVKVEKTGDTHALSVTIEFLSSLNITDPSELPAYEKTRERIRTDMEFIRSKIQEYDSGTDLS